MTQPINDEMVKRLKRGIDFANEQFAKHYPDEEMHWSLTEGFLTWNNDFAMVKITPDTIITTLTAFEAGIGHQVVTEPNLLNCYLTPNLIVNYVTGHLTDDKDK